MVYTVKREGGLHADVPEKGDAYVAPTMKTGTAKGGRTKTGSAKGGGPRAVPRRPGVPMRGRTASDSFRRVCPRDVVQICIFIRGEILVAKWLSRDWREPFMQTLARTPKRRESGASGHRARQGLDVKGGCPQGRTGGL